MQTALYSDKKYLKSFALILTACILVETTVTVAIAESDIFQPNLKVIHELNGQLYTHGIAWSENDKSVAFYGRYGNYLNVWSSDGYLIDRLNRSGAWYAGGSLAFLPTSAGIVTPPDSGVMPESAFTEFSLSNRGQRHDVPGPYPRNSGLENAAYIFAQSKDGNWLAAISRPSHPTPIRLYSLPSFQLSEAVESIQQNYSDAATSLALSQTGEWLAVGLIDGHIIIYNTFHHNVVRTIAAFADGSAPAPVTSIAIDATSHTVAAAIADNVQQRSSQPTLVITDSVRMFNFLSGNRLSSTLPAPDAVVDLSWSPQRREIALVKKSGKLVIWSYDRDTPNLYEIPNLDSVVSVKFSHDEKRLAVAHGPNVDILVDDESLHGRGN